MTISGIAQEIYIELGTPEDVSNSSIQYWLRTNVGKINILLNDSFSINTGTNEFSTTPNFGELEKSIYKKLYNIHYYDRQILNLVGKSRNINLVNTTTSDSSTSSIVSGVGNTLEISENGFSYRKDTSINTKTANDTIRANTQFVRQLGLNFVELKKQENEELKNLLNKYELNENTPLQVAGDDTVGDPGRSYTYSNYVRNLENL